MDDPFAGADAPARDDPALVARAADALCSIAEGDLRGRVPRSKAYVRRLQELTIDRPALGIAVARAINMDHVVETLLDGVSVEGVPGIGPDGAEIAPTPRHRARAAGRWILGSSVLVLLAEAIVAYGMAPAVIYCWTTAGLALFFVGPYLVFMLRQ